jgi:hypothetical protein
MWKEQAMAILNVQRFGFLESFSKTTYHIDKMSHKQSNIGLIPAFSYVPIGTVTATGWMVKVRVCLTVKATFFDKQIQQVNQCTMKCFLLYFSTFKFTSKLESKYAIL